jgi:CheY-like chemotaxis protein
MPKRLGTEATFMMARGVAHNFNNLLAAVLGQTSLARAKLAAESPALVHLDRAMAACVRAAELTRQLLVYTGRVAVQPHMLSLNALLYEALALVQPQLSAPPQWRLDLDVHVPMLAGDAGRMRGVLVDLLMNAAEAAGGAAGAVTVRSGVMQVDERTIMHVAKGDVLAPGAYAFLAVQDNGVGVDAERQERIFDSLFSTKQSGQEPSFFACLGGVRLHDDGIALESERGRGSTFCIFLPLAPAVTLAQPSGLAALAPEAHKDTILVVDDEPAVREVLAEAVEIAGLHALTAEDGRQGLETFRTHQGAIALIVLDMQMPVMNGAETAKELWKLEPGLPLILTSGYVEPRLVDDLVRHPAAAFLPKPYTIDTFLTMLQGRLEFGGIKPA